MSDLIFDNLNDAQKKAVKAVKGPVLILAGAGSGKTRALTHRIAYLIEQGIPAWQILSVTFTNKAATEMKERITNLLKLSDPDQKQLPMMGTFHSVCVRILKRDIEAIGRNRNFVIYDSSDQQTLMKQILKEMGIDPKELKPKTALGHISSFKSEAMGPKKVAEEATSDWMARIVKIYGAYQKSLRENNALDFDDLILETVRLFQEVPKVLERYQNTWKFVNVDEYQDTNHAQYLLISLLAGKNRNLCVIGDPDQSIYAFRGADIRNIMEFMTEYPDAISIKLEQNYRSTQPILDSADAVIAKNPSRPQKKMWTKRVDGEKLTVHEVSDEKEEAKEAVERVMAQLTNGTSLNEQVVLYRTNAQSRLFEEACMKAAVPYRIVGGVKFYARKEVKDVLAYLHTIHNPHDALSLLRVINIPSRKIGKTTITKLQAFCSERGIDLWSALRQIEMVEGLTDPVKRRIKHFVEIIEAYRNMRTEIPVSSLAERLLTEIQMEKWVRDQTTEGETRWQNIGELLTVMHKYDRLSPEQSFTSFLEEVALVSEVDKLNDARDDALTLMTLHLCKGLEFQHVIIAGCEEGIFPHSNALMDKEQLEEERRLMYVGMTRAKDELRCFCARSRMLWGETQSNEPSRFLDDLPPELVERKSDDIMSKVLWNLSSSSSEKKSKLEPFRQNKELEFNQDLDFSEDFNQERTDLEEGTRVKHPVFGEGAILEKRGDIVDVLFDSGQKKSLALSIAPLKMI
jgi:DNA helicase-2/ATP-dependent DNA helicase PcrA